MAQGYLKCSTAKQQMEEVGNQFVKMFFMNSFFQDAFSEYDEIISFKMHDLMHDLAMLVAGGDYCCLDSEAEKVEGRPMHVSLESCEAIHLLKSLDPSRLRTLILPDDLEEEEDLSVITEFKYLRVLRMHHLSDSTEHLKHLRYLVLTQQKSLPKSISNLVCLQTLKLKGCDKESFSEVVTKLVNLRCLDVADYDSVSGMAGLGKLCSLQLLSTFVVRDSQEIKYGTLNELKDLNLRGELRIEHLNRVRDVALESQYVNLREKKFLRSLTLDWSYGDIIRNSDSLQLLENLQPHRNLKHLEVNHYPGVLFPNWLSLLTNVVYISLSACYNCRCLPPLERLPYLESLNIQFLYELESIYLCEDGFAVNFFPSLKSLKLGHCPRLRGWRRRGDDIKDSHNLSLPLSFPHLSHLDVFRCPKLTFPNVENLKKLKISDPMNLPKGWMQNLTSLESLHIGWCKSETLEEFETWFKDDTDCLPSLGKIVLYMCERLKALPDWICNLSAIQHVMISGCRKLALLPEGMSGLINLKIFEVSRCSLLLKECRTETSVVSRQIAHIPQIILHDY
ncbi:putative disease resistance protein RGA3 [Abrus precatorius]|uniref:Disease resistance protein RGA3 n=1 Tax=Abrus precatorius TaxID=3816 RepID=A0A8B8K0N5_ABRPR|nr:putative disease resistance protein RGA3 [Abrus precatorius]